MGRGEEASLGGFMQEPSPLLPAIGEEQHPPPQGQLPPSMQPFTPTPASGAPPLRPHSEPHWFPLTSPSPHSQPPHQALPSSTRAAPAARGVCMPLSAAACSPGGSQPPSAPSTGPVTMSAASPSTGTWPGLAPLSASGSLEEGGPRSSSSLAGRKRVTWQDPGEDGAGGRTGPPQLAIPDEVCKRSTSARQLGGECRAGQCGGWARCGHTLGDWVGAGAECTRADAAAGACQRTCTEACVPVHLSFCATMDVTCVS